MKEAESRELYDIFTHVYAKNISDMIKAKHLSQVLLSQAIHTHRYIHKP